MWLLGFWPFSPWLSLLYHTVCVCACVFVCVHTHTHLHTHPEVTNLQSLAVFRLLAPLCLSVVSEEKQWRPLKESLITVIAAWVIRKSIRYFHLDNCSQTKRTGMEGRGHHGVYECLCVRVVGGCTLAVWLNPPDTHFSHQASLTGKGLQWKFPLVEETTCGFKIWCQVPVSLCGRNASFVGRSLV